MKKHIFSFFFLLFISVISAEKEIILYMQKQNPKLSEKEARFIYKNVVHYSNEYDFDPVLVFSVMKTESHFKHSTVSSAGAKGLLQLMPFNFKEFGVDNSIEGNIKGGIMHLKRDYEKTGNITKTLICYNAGCGRLKNNEWRKIRETTDYITKINDVYPEIKNLFYSGINTADRKPAVNIEKTTFSENIEYEEIRELTKQEKFQRNKIAFKRDTGNSERGANEKD